MCVSRFQYSALPIDGVSDTFLSVCPVVRYNTNCCLIRTLLALDVCYYVLFNSQAMLDQWITVANDLSLKIRYND